MERAQLNFANKQPPKKKRKSRTAFTNHQIFELEKRFLYQKYLSPADRDEIAAQLGLSNAQVTDSTLKLNNGLSSSSKGVATVLVRTKMCALFDIYTVNCILFNILSTL